jgi:hypothetical protein
MVFADFLLLPFIVMKHYLPAEMRSLGSLEYNIRNRSLKQRGISMNSSKGILKYHYSKKEAILL